MNKICEPGIMERNPESKLGPAMVINSDSYH